MSPTRHNTACGAKWNLSFTDEQPTSTAEACLNVVRRPYSGSRRGTSPYKLSYYYLLFCVKLHRNGQTDKHQGRQSRIYETAGSLEPTRNDAFSLNTEQKRATTKFIAALAKETVNMASATIILV